MTPTHRHLLANIASSPPPHHRHQQHPVTSTRIRRPQRRVCHPRRAYNERRGNPTSPIEGVSATTPHHHHTTPQLVDNTHATTSTVPSGRADRHPSPPNDHNTAPNNANTTPRHPVNKRRPGAMSPSATWQPDGE
ncbi:hypothetical protein K443DRAFT_15406 [Laccaria amethystina LaAM-08-1]|uniref:Uncharacterized protein n=1 Tax=Laccaria amethystina LaAM-08-1 TaxID=1095629 RepID=A0A0C9WGY0_9AGAR|nr:hypothetical protein K443DRAFT_15406 [Laccaria amethystina LaAM-08-1]